MTIVPQQLVSAVEKGLGISLEEITSRSRKKPVVDARATLAFLLREHCGMSSTAIGSYLRRDHTSVLNLLKRQFVPDQIYARVNLDPSLKYYETKQGAGGKWSRLLFSRGGTCEIPKCGFDDVIEVHHLVSKKLGGTDHETNLIVLCPNHHSLIHVGALFLSQKAFPHIVIPMQLRTGLGDN